MRDRSYYPHPEDPHGYGASNGYDAFASEYDEHANLDQFFATSD